MKKVIQFRDRKILEQEAAEWLIKLDGDDDLSVHEQEKLHEWLGRSSSHRQVLEELVSTWGGANVLTELAVPINQQTSEQSVRSGIFSRRFTSIAASLFVALSLGSFFYLDSTSITQRNGVITTQIGDQKSVDLPDGSVIKINTNSKVQIDYTKEFRNIHLIKGEAHFDVAKDKSKPFRVYAGSGRIHAIGTAFSVYLKGDKVDVTVSEGRVGVASIPISLESAPNVKGLPTQAKPIKSLGTLRAGEAGTIVSQLDENSDQVQKLENLRKIENVDIAKELSWTNGVLVFAGEPLNEVVEEISRYTSVSIEFSDPELESIRIGGRFPVGETETMFASLEDNFGLQITRLDSDRVVISGAKQY